jgi:hypothetical protein
MSDFVEKAKDAVEGAADKIKDVADDAVDKVKDIADKAGDDKAAPDSSSSSSA